MAAGMKNSKHMIVTAARRNKGNGKQTATNRKPCNKGRREKTGSKREAIWFLFCVRNGDLKLRLFYNVAVQVVDGCSIAAVAILAQVFQVLLVQSTSVMR